MKQLLQEILPEIIKIRHQIHANPELAHEEKGTASLVANTLKSFGYVTENIAGTGVTTILDSNKPGKTVALRADMDALPITETTDLLYKSTNPGKMHACGHDGHTATLLATAMTLTKYVDQFRGKIKFIFQPAEETGTGANALINAGVLDNPRIDAIFGYHNTPKSKFGVFKTKVGCIHAAQDIFNITIHGRGGHGAQPQLTIDPIYIGSLIVQALQGVVSRLNTPSEPIVVSVTQFHGGTTHNVIPHDAILTGTIRTLNPQTQTLVKQQISDIASGISKTYGAQGITNFSNSFPPTINHPHETDIVIATAKQVLDIEHVEALLQPSMGSEDFSCYLEKIPGCFFWIGMGLENLSIHNSTYEFNDAIIPIAAEILAKTAINYLNQN